MSLFSWFLLAAAMGFTTAEAISPRRREQRRLSSRPRLVADLLFFLGNGAVLGGLLYTLTSRYLGPALTAGAAWLKLDLSPRAGLLVGLPLWLEIPAALLLIDATHWGIHNLMHRVPAFWRLHEVHHSIRDGEMDWLGGFRVHWGEGTLYALLQLPVLLWLAPSGWALLVHALVGTAWNFLNHANLDLGRGLWRYLLNSPRMHLWHHDADADRATNFGVIFSLWDWLFGTARLPGEAPARLGFPGVERLPRGFVGLSLWPLSALWSRPVVTSPTPHRRHHANDLSFRP